MDYIVELSWLMILIGAIKFVYIAVGYRMKAEVLLKNNEECGIPLPLAVFIEECPMFFLPLGFTLQTDINYGTVLSLMIMAHHLNSAFIYPFNVINLKARRNCIKVIVSTAFSCCNGYIQGAYNANFQPHFDKSNEASVILFTLGIAVFICGLFVNFRSGVVVIDLEEAGDPKTFTRKKADLYNYAKLTKYVGEMLEWAGYALTAHNLPATAFAIYTFCNSAPRAYSVPTPHQFLKRSDLPEHLDVIHLPPRIIRKKTNNRKRR